MQGLTCMHTRSGVARRVHVGSYAPSPYTSAPFKLQFFNVYQVLAVNSLYGQFSCVVATSVYYS